MKVVYYRFKAYVLANSSTGYTIKMKIHASSNKKYRNQSKWNENFKRIVSELLKDIEEGHIVYTDSHYISIKLQKYSEIMGFLFCGLISIYRKDLAKIEFESLNKF